MITVWTNHQKVDKSISSYAIIYFDHSFYVFGGESMYDTQNKHPTTIARLDTVTTAWSKVGDMTSWKRYHRVIHDGTYFIVVGGGAEYGANGEHGYHETERCSLVGSNMTCVAQEPTLTACITPGLFLVEADFCNEIDDI